ncbi:hypothetical protein Golob_005831 [Gossypium lobatum]|uniref:Aminotransferase-like plant mobile domain-containing protein n=1 Tax=Gossypium lobatum TaxID=34289 RepID=A0A7J8MUG1_9ROSI|nr:hypothetical protein [Gossypium lobatum]
MKIDTSTFYLAYSKCTITPENIALQLSLSVDRPFVTGSVVVPDKEGLCEAFLGKVLDKWNHGASYVGLPKQLEDIRLLLDQRSKAEFEWMPYVESDIIKYVLPKFLVIQSMWDANVLLIVYATMEMHESDRVIQQFGWRQKILQPPYDMEVLHKLDLRGKTNENCYLSIVSQTPLASLFYQGGSSAQPLSCGVDDTQWEVRTTLHLSTDEGNGDKDKDEIEGGDEDEYKHHSRDKNERKGRGKDEEDEDDGYD